jgi:hypothetical protein
MNITLNAHISNFDKENNSYWYMHSYIEIRKSLFPEIIKIRNCKYDGVPYKIITLGPLDILVGRQGWWDSICFRDDNL